MESGLLKLVVTVAREAGALLRTEFTSGPVGQAAQAPIDTRVERLIYEQLKAETPTYGFLGEETGSVDGDGRHVWVVDPQDGTSFYIRGARGPAVSIALLRDQIPVLGVVYAYAAPDHAGDLIAWVEGRPLTRNGRVVRLPNWNTTLAPDQVVLASPAANIAPQAAADVVSPARFDVSPSIAYRLALVAVGDADATISVAPLSSWDIAAGHALLRGSGAHLLDQDGKEVVYEKNGSRSLSACFGGAKMTALELSKRRILGRTLKEKSAPYVTLIPGESVTDFDVLRRAQGCMLGCLASDTYGFEEHQALDHGGLRPIGRPSAETNPAMPTGQLKSHAELTITLARSIVTHGDYEPIRIREEYKSWVRSEPIQAPSQFISSLLSTRIEAAHSENEIRQSSVVLSRLVPLGIFGVWSAAERLEDLVRHDAALTHPEDEVCSLGATFVATLAFIIRTGASPRAALEFARDHSGNRTLGATPSVAGHGETGAHLALNNALYQLQHQSSVRDAIHNALRDGNNESGLGPIYGALFGATFGRRGIPRKWSKALRSCRPLRGTTYPRPAKYWAVDVLPLTERLLLAGRKAAIDAQ
jgi:fructose-1,6-bisphosphatase/inositol monophosphatase family enzyme/ADP-ribosylglycohydrolase